MAHNRPTGDGQYRRDESEKDLDTRIFAGREQVYPRFPMEPHRVFADRSGSMTRGEGHAT
jgi:hypothetical protein